MANAFDQFETLIVENLGTSVLDMHMPEIDDPALNFMASAEPLGPGGRSDDGNYYEARRKLKLSRGGMITGGTFDGNTMTFGGANNDLPYGQTPTALAPDPAEVPTTQYITIKSRLKRIIGNITLNMSQLLNDILSMSLEEVAVGYMEDATFQVRKNMLSWFYSDGTGKIATVATTDDATPATGAIAALTFSDAPYNRFIKGQRYMLYSVFNRTTKTVRANLELLCVNIDDVNKSVDFENIDATGGGTVAAGDVVVLKGTQGTTGALPAEVSAVPMGVEGLFNNTGEFFGFSDRTQYGELISYIDGDENNKVAPEPDLIALQVNRIAKAGYAPPTVLVSESVLSAQYGFTEKAGYATYVVPNFMASPNGGVGQPIFQHGTVVMPWLTSEYIRPGMLLGLAPDTLMKFQPTGGDTIRWWNARGPGAGISGVFVPVTSSATNNGRQQTELWQAPFETHCEFMTAVPKRSFRYVGLTTQED